MKTKTKEENLGMDKYNLQGMIFALVCILVEIDALAVFYYYMGIR